MGEGTQEMKAFYLTTALPEKERKLLLDEGEAPNNPSNQNYHSRLMECLSTFLDIEAVSRTRYAKRLGEVPGWTFLDASSPFPGRTPCLPVEENDLIFFDGLSQTLFKDALALTRKHKARAILVLTDNPENISGVAGPYLWAFRRNIARFAETGEIAITLNDRLAEIFGLARHVNVPFVLREQKTCSRKAHHNCPFLYYSGVLLPAYGFPNLRKGFALWSERHGGNPPLDLLFAGHRQDILFRGPEEPHLRFLGELTEKENIEFMKEATLLINPRTPREKLDEESIPSKMFEYLAYGGTILSGRHPFFLRNFPNDINFLEDGSPEGILSWLEEHVSPDGSLDGTTTNKAAPKIKESYSMQATARLLQEALAVKDHPAK